MGMYVAQNEGLHEPIARTAEPSGTSDTRHETACHASQPLRLDVAQAFPRTPGSIGGAALKLGSGRLVAFRRIVLGNLLYNE